VAREFGMRDPEVTVDDADGDVLPGQPLFVEVEGTDASGPVGDTSAGAADVAQPDRLDRRVGREVAHRRQGHIGLDVVGALLDVPALDVEPGRGQGPRLAEFHRHEHLAVDGVRRHRLVPEQPF